MRGRVNGSDWLIERLGNDPVVDDEDGADRHLARSRAEPGLLERGAHEVFAGHSLRTTVSGLRQPLSKEKPVGRVLVLRCVGIRQLVEERAKCRQFVVDDFESGEHAAEISAVVPVVEQADVPAATELLEKLRQRAWPFGKLEAAQTLVANLGRMAANHVPHVQLGELVVRQVYRLVTLRGELRY